MLQLRSSAAKQNRAGACCSVTQSCPTFCDPMDCSMLGFRVFHYLPEFAQTHVHRVGDAIQSSHPLLSPSPSAFYLSKHQGVFQWVSFKSGGQNIGASASASVFAMTIQGWFPLGLTGLISLQSKGLSRVFFNTQFKSISSSVLSFFYCPTLCNLVECRPPGSSVHRSVSLAQWEYWNELACPLEGGLPEPGIEPASHGSPALQAIA